MKLTFTVPGIPRPKGRPRLGKGGNIYTPDRTSDFEHAVATYARSVMVPQGWRAMYQGPCAVWLHVYLPDNRRSDADNIAKTCLDGGNKTIWFDDSQVIELHVYRRVDRDNPRIEFTVESLEEKAA